MVKLTAILYEAMQALGDWKHEQAEPTTPVASVA